MQITVVRPSELGPNEIATWHSIQRQTESLVNPFLCPEFAVAVDNFRPNARVAVLADGTEIVGFFPFERRPFGVGVPIGAGLNNCQGLIHIAAVEWDSRELLRACKIAVWQFDKLVEGQRSFEHYADTVVRSGVIDLTEGFATYEEKLRVKSARFCKNLRQNRFKLERHAGELRHVIDSRDIVALRTLMRWKSDQCRRKGWVDLFDRPWIIDLTDHLFSTQSDWFGGLVTVLYAGELPVAAAFGLRCETLFAAWFHAYDSRYGKYSPGLLQLMQMAKGLAAAGLHTIELGDDPAAYLERLKSHDIFFAKGVAARGPLHASAYRGRTALESWARHQIKQHPPLFRAADRLLRHYGRIS